MLECSQPNRNCFRPMSDYRTEWQEFRRRRKLYSLMLWGFYPLCGLAAVSEVSEMVARSKLFVSLALLYAALLLFVAGRVNRWPCPRCKQPFCAVFRSLVTSCDACQHCGLSVDANSTPSMRRPVDVKAHFHFRLSFLFPSYFLLLSVSLFPFS
jgi:hypothetical protein